VIARCLSPLAVVAALSCPSAAESDTLTVLVRVADGRAAIDDRGAVVLARGTTARIQIDVGGPASSHDLEMGLLGMPSRMRRTGPRTFVIEVSTDDDSPRHGTLDIRGANGARVLRDVVVQGAPALRLPHRPWELGVFGGYRETGYGQPTTLGEPAPGASLSAGASTGLRAGWARDWLGVELELGIDRLANARLTDEATLLAYRAFGVVRHDDGHASFRLTAGVGAQSVIVPSDGLERDTKLAFAWGVTGGFRRGSLLLRLDVRHELLPGQDDLAHGANLLLGISLLR
jgi:hypothetical protein